MNKLTKKSVVVFLSGSFILGIVTQVPVSCAEKIGISSASQEQGTQVLTSRESDFLFEVIDGVGTITGYLGDELDLIIPEKISGIEVQAFTGGAFSFQKFTSIQLPSTASVISRMMFYKCSELKNVVIPDTVKTIENQAFDGCESLERIFLPQSITSIRSSAFANCILLDDVMLPDSLTGILGLGGSVFKGCSNLKRLYIPESVNYNTVQDLEQCKEQGITLYGVSGSLTEYWSKQYGINFVVYTGQFTNESLSSSNAKEYFPLPTATLHTSYLTGIHDINSNSTLISGNLPKGLGLYEDGVIGGIPQETGTFEFVISTSEGEVGYSITVEAPTAQNVEANNDFDIIERVPTVDSNEKEYIFEVTGEFSDFLNVYLDGELLVKDVHYFSEEGSTKITIAAQTMSQLDSGSHTINAVFTTTNTTITPSSSSGSASSGTITTTNSSKSANVESVAQVFEKTVEPAPMMAMPFTDVAVSDWHYQYVRYMYDTSTFSGVTDTTYEPDTGMTRAMMAVVFYGMANKPSTNSANFSDVADGEWYADAVNWVSTSGIDDSVGNYRPNDLITREETAKMMYNFCTYQGIFIPLTTSRTPSDMNSVSETAKNAVNVLFSKGIFAGDDANNFNPHNTSTRAEISAMMRTFMWATV